MWKIAAIVFLVLIVLLVMAIICQMEEMAASMRSQRKIMKRCADNCSEWKKLYKQAVEYLEHNIKMVGDTTLGVQAIRNMAERIQKDNIRLTEENEELRERNNKQAEMLEEVMN